MTLKNHPNSQPTKRRHKKSPLIDRSGVHIAMSTAGQDPKQPRVRTRLGGVRRHHWHQWPETEEACCVCSIGPEGTREQTTAAHLSVVPTDNGGPLLSIRFLSGTSVYCHNGEQAPSHRVYCGSTKMNDLVIKSFLLVLVIWFSSFFSPSAPSPVSSITVKTPADLQASKGDTVTLSCTFISSSTPTSKMTVDWSYRPPTGGPPQTVSW